MHRCSFHHSPPSNQVHILYKFAQLHRLIVEPTMTLLLLLAGLLSVESASVSAIRHRELAAMNQPHCQGLEVGYDYVDNDLSNVQAAKPGDCCNL